MPSVSLRLSGKLALFFRSRAAKRTQHSWKCCLEQILRQYTILETTSEFPLLRIPTSSFLFPQALAHTHTLEKINNKWPGAYDRLLGYSQLDSKKKKKIQTASSTQFSFSNNTVHTPKKEKRFKKKNIAKMIIVQMYYTCNILSWPVTTRSLKQSAPISVGLYGPTQVRATLVSRSQDKLLVSKHSS